MQIAPLSTVNWLVWVLWLLQGMLFSAKLCRGEEKEECRSLVQHVMRISGRKYSCSPTEEKAYHSSELSTFTQTTRSHIRSHGSKAALGAAYTTQPDLLPCCCALINQLIRGQGEVLHLVNQRGSLGIKWDFFISERRMRHGSRTAEALKWISIILKQIKNKIKNK